jgi:hypothetical protein
LLARNRLQPGVEGHALRIFLRKRLDGLRGRVTKFLRPALPATTVLLAQRFEHREVAQPLRRQRYGFLS